MSYCYNPGRHVKSKTKEGKENKRGTWKYPCSLNENCTMIDKYRDENGFYRDRTVDEVRNQMREGLKLSMQPEERGKKKVPYKGFKGFSTFPYESHMCVLKECVHSVRGVCMQIAEKVVKNASLPYLAQSIEMSEYVKLAVQKMNLGHSAHVGEGTANGGILLGRGVAAVLSSEQQAGLEAAGFRNEGMIFQFENVICKGVKYSTASYCSRFKRNNSVIQITNDNSFARIQKILRIRDECYFVVEILSTRKLKYGRVTFSHIKEVW